MKIVIILLLLVGVALAAPQLPKALCNSYDQHSLIFGCKEATNNLLMARAISVPGRLFQVQIRTLSESFAEEVTCIRVINKTPNNKGGCPKIINGGNKNYVEIQFVSQVSQGLDFMVEIYGKQPTG